MGVSDSHRHLLVAAAMFLAGTAQSFTIVSGDGSIFTMFAFSAFFLVCVGSLWQFYQTRRQPPEVGSI